MLIGKSRFGRFICLPASGDIGEVAALARLASDAGRFHQRVNRCFVQTLPSRPRPLAQGGIDSRRNASNRVPHPIECRLRTLPAEAGPLPPVSGELIRPFPSDVVTRRSAASVRPRSSAAPWRHSHDEGAHGGGYNSCLMLDGYATERPSTFFDE
jgi:hypothetical protein